MRLCRSTVFHPSSRSTSAVATSSFVLSLATPHPPSLTLFSLTKGWCAKGQNCTPPIDDYLQKVSPLLLLSPPNTRVLVTTDEQTDLDFLASIDALGWYRIDHALLGTQAKLEAAFGEAWRWADSATDQAILSLGRHFVGTRGSQVSQLSELRVQTWNGGQSAIVDRPMR
jgi:hypothetical protein